MKTNLILRALPALALLLASPARADKSPCEGLTCAAVIPVAVAYMGYLRLVPTPPLILAVQALDANDNAELERLLAKHPALTRLTPEQSAALAKMEADGRTGRIDNLYVLTLSESDDDSFRKGMIDRDIGISDWHGLEFELKTHPAMAAAVDNGYVLLTRAAWRGKLEAVRMLLAAGVRADSHRSGALAAARDDDVRQLLMRHGARAPAAAPAGTRNAEPCPDDAGTHPTSG